ncbi:hypothetical protein BDB00DRAFT_794196 [Zychaea mexicana]|uniref:uncharacterized protein n=1 Tax=Zychaea mexicana TaxID=64656 RepID=UPI0022FEFE9E|nr:uncharacterized protein BDB00DRAFT_794196 [Zychaea mexicana]KAI9499493.1 hypothetical protein BDB00DRAFT_794196 [Zychaea mexicana]
MTVRLQQQPRSKKIIKPPKHDRFAHIQPQGSWEIPRKTFHYSIGFLVLYLFKNGFDSADTYPALVAFLSIVLATEALRFSWDSFNVLYCRVMGSLMRKSEVKSRINGTAYYLVGVLIALYVFPKDIASLSIIYLSWADPTASICGRLWGKYTPKYGNKSLAGTLGAMVVGALVTYYFFSQFLTESYDPVSSDIPTYALALYGGLVAGLSEALGDSAGLDDNLIIPVASSIFLWVPLVFFEL